jgi:large subunit ribosomal protein L23
MIEKAYQILKRPLLTEKSTTQKESFNKLFFEVDQRAS